MWSPDTVSLNAHGVIGNNIPESGSVAGPYPALPPLRLSSVHAQIISAGLNWLVRHDDLWLNDHTAPHGRPDFRWVVAPAKRGVYQQRYMEIIRRLHAAMQEIVTKGGRLRQLDSCELAALALAVRTARQARVNGLFRPTIPRFEQTVRRLLKTLEKHRKRAKRAQQRAVGAEVYRDHAAAWRSFVRWVRLHFLQFKPKARGSFRFRRELINNLVGWTRAELTDRGARVPAESELRRLVRLAVRYVRRGRTKYIRIDLYHHHRVAAERLATFVTVYTEKHSLEEKHEQAYEETER